MTIRPARPDEYPATESLTRDAFWNKYKPGCDEHLILHNFRRDPALVPELDCVLEDGGELIAHIMYCRAHLDSERAGRVPVLMFGPISVRPDRQHQGYGSALINETLSRASALGHGAVLITGSPAYYARFGFESCSRHGIYYRNADRSDPADYFMCRELRPNYLPDGLSLFVEPAGYTVDSAELARFEMLFPPRRKERRPGQLR